MGVHTWNLNKDENLDRFTDSTLTVESKISGFQILSRVRTTVAGGIPALELINVLGVGTVGKSRKLCTIREGIGICLNAETYLDSWPALEPLFDRILRSFALKHD